MDEVLEFLPRSSWGVILAVVGAHGLIVAVLVALLVAALVGLILWVVPPTRAYAGIVAVIVFLVLLLLSLL